MSGADAALLNIDANGAVRLTRPADFETKNSYSFTVNVSDSGSSTPKAVTLTITDINELPPTPTINEVATPNDSIATAQTIDRNVLAVLAKSQSARSVAASATILGSISANADTDFFSIHLEKGEKLILDVDGTTNSLDTHIHVFDAAGNEIGDNDDQGDFDPGSSPPFDHNTDFARGLPRAAAGYLLFLDRILRQQLERQLPDQRQHRPAGDPGADHRGGYRGAAQRFAVEPHQFELRFPNHRRPISGQFLP